MGEVTMLLYTHMDSQQNRQISIKGEQKSGIILSQPQNATSCYFLDSSIFSLSLLSTTEFDVFHHNHQV